MGKIVKRWSRKKKEAMIKGEWERLPELALNKKNRTLHKISTKSSIKANKTMSC